MNDFSNRLKKTLLAAAGVVVIIGAGGAWWYFSMYTKTPEFALQKIEDSISQNNKDEFYKYVAVNHVLDTAGDALLSGMVETAVSPEQDQHIAFTEFSKMFKTPVVNILQTAVDNYVLNGQWIDDQIEPSSEMGNGVMLAKAGLTQITFKGVDSLEKVDDDTAVANVRIFQSEANEDFILHVEMKKNAEGIWQVYEITNVKEFVSFVNEGRKILVKNYIDESNKLASEYDVAIREAEKNVSMAISTGSLGDNNLREELAKIVKEELLVQWQQEKSALESMSVPAAAGTLHKLKLKTCDANISYAENYALWLHTKDLKDLRKAEENLRIARTLEKDVKQLSKQMEVHAQ